MDNGTYPARNHPPGVKAALASAVRGPVDIEAGKDLAGECHRMALAYLLLKQRRGNLRPDLIGSPLELFAFECCRELFHRDGNGRYPQLVDYFASVDWERVGEEDVHIILRRLVFSKVNEKLFQTYGEEDRTLASTVQEIRDAAGSIPLITLERRGKEEWLLVVNGGTLPVLPLLPVEVLEAFFASSVPQAGQLQQVLSSFSDFVKEQPGYFRGYPITGFAYALRAVLLSLGTSPLGSSIFSGR